MPLKADDHCNGNEGNADDGGNAERSVSAVYEEAEEDSQNDEEDGDHRSAGVCGACCNVDCTVRQEGCLEGVSDDGSKCCDNEEEGQVSENEEQTLCLETDTIFDNGTDGLALVADRCEQSAEVMHAAEEDAADEDPQCNGNPAEDSSLNRSVNRASAGDGGEVVTHEHRSLCGHIVNTVFHGVCGSDLVGIDSPFLGQPSAVEDIAYNENGDADDK